jgi:hypothetical protein
MKKRVLLIGNNNGLEGVNVDFQNYSHFFQSKIGGEWYQSEIIPMMNPSRLALILKINELKAMVLDYLIVIFSGHGGQERETVLELNNRGETISESELKYISSRQLNIYDCCRSYPSIAEASQRSLKMFNLGGAIERSTRAMYEKRIQNSIQQQICLYACSIGETAEDTSKGGVYSSNLLEVAISIKGTTESYYLVGQTHIAAKSIVKSRGYRQNPDATLPRCISTQQLIFSINPHIYIY